MTKTSKLSVGVSTHSTIDSKELIRVLMDCWPAILNHPGSKNHILEDLQGNA